MKSPLLLALVLAVAPALAAQDTARVSPDSVLVPGTRIRMIAPWSPTRRIVGTVEMTRGDSVVVDTADVFAERRLFNPVPVLVDDVRRVTVPVSRIERVDVSMGRSRLMGALKGATLGALAAGAYVGLTALNGRGNPEFGDFAAGFVQGAAFGVALGGPVGWSFTTERWRPVALRLPGRDRNFGGRR